MADILSCPQSGNQGHYCDICVTSTVCLLCWYFIYICRNAGYAGGYSEDGKDRRSTDPQVKKDPTVKNNPPVKTKDEILKDLQCDVLTFINQ